MATHHRPAVLVQVEHIVCEFCGRGYSRSDVAVILSFFVFSTVISFISLMARVDGVLPLFVVMTIALIVMALFVYYKADQYRKTRQPSTQEQQANNPSNEETLPMRPTAPPIQQTPSDGHLESPDVNITINDSISPQRLDDNLSDTGLPPPSYEEVMSGRFTEVNLEDTGPSSEKLDSQGLEITDGTT